MNYAIDKKGFKETELLTQRVKIMTCRLYCGYCIRSASSIVGLIWTVLDGLIGGAFTWIYTLPAGRLETGIKLFLFPIKLLKR